LTDLAGRWH